VWESLPHPFRRHSSEFLARDLVETGRKRRSVGVPLQVAGALFQYLGPFSDRVTLAILSVQITWYNVLDLLLTGRRKYVVQNSKFTSLFWFVAPTGRDRVPNTVRQPLTLTRVPWAGWSFTTCDAPNGRRRVRIVTVWRYPRKDLIIAGRLRPVVGPFTNREHTEKEAMAME